MVMIKRQLLFLCILCICLGFLIGCGYTQEDQIREDYLAHIHAQGETEMTLDDVTILNNYGTYNGAVVIRMQRGAYQVITTIKIDGIEFTFSDSNTALVWKDGQFFELSDAYDNEVLTKDNLISIAKKVNK
jgi:hypothetical protein